MTIYGLMADLHCHPWSSFSIVDSEGRNDRLMHIIHEIRRCCAEVRRRGGRLVFIAGDVFHTRGSVVPSVFNPLRDALEDEAKNAMQFYIIPGNHDLEGRTSNTLTSAVEMLSGVESVFTKHDPDMIGSSMAVIPWEPDIKALLNSAAYLAAHRCEPAKTDLIIHAGIDGVLLGMPDHGLTVDMLTDLGFRRVFAGHYHNHKFMGRGVWSIGAPTHQTWSDVGSRAGWLIVDPKEVHFFASHAPNFINITGVEDQDELPLIVDGHYVRACVEEATPSEVDDLRSTLRDMGARGVLVQSIPAKSVGVRTPGIATTTLASLDRAIANYCVAKGLSSDVITDCDALLKEVQP